MPDSLLPLKKKPSGRGWVSFFAAVVIFTVLWLSTGDSSNILDMPWWSFLAVIVIQAIIQTVWGRIKPINPQ
jgi:hypothetical protein